MAKPQIKPENPNFSSGPTAKFKGWDLSLLKDALVGRSHRSKPGLAKLNEVIDLHREILGIPNDYLIGIVPASDTGAVEMAMWSMLGARGVDVIAWESFSKDWLLDSRDHLKLKDLRVFEADYGQMVDLTQIDTDRDVVFVWNGTTSGVRLPNADWVKSDRKGLTICDATSAVFSYDLPWDKLDVTTWSWQKALGGEAAHGMLVLSPRAVERLETYTPDRPLPKIFRMVKKGVLNREIFAGATINTPSMLAVEDCIVCLNWVKKLGGVQAMIKRSQANHDAVAQWLAKSSDFAPLAASPETSSTTSICFKVVDPWFIGLSDDEQTAIIKSVCSVLEKDDVAYDIKHYRTAPAGFRIWGGGNIETSDIAAALPWIDWAYQQAKSEKSAQNAA